MQSVLNFQPTRTRTADEKRPPVLTRQAKSDVDMLKDETDGKFDGNENTQETEDTESTQDTLISWPSSTSSTTTTRRCSRDSQDVDESVRRLEKMELRRRLAQVAQETVKVLPGLLALTPHAPPRGYLYAPPQPSQLHRRYCPNFPPTAVRIHDADTLDTAIGLAKCAKYITVHDKRPVCVLNMANAHTAGGGWKNGALAQEEALCYRSSLPFTLKTRYYPIPEFGAIYSPTVIVIRKNMAEGHEFYPLDKPEQLPVVGAVSVAALCQPKLAAHNNLAGAGPDVGRERYANPADRETTKEKLRLILRTAAYNGHRRLVLGALGCGAFCNPREEVADCWAEVFAEQEFGGGWWESVIFAVMDDTGEGEKGNCNFGVFFRRLNGMMV